MSKTLNDMAKMAKALIAAEERVVEVGEYLSECKEKARVLREETIPCAMEEVGLKEYTLDTGERLSVFQEVYTSIPSSRKDEAFEWLYENDFEGLIKTEVKAAYNKGSSQDALELMSELVGRGVKASFSQSVHHSTLKSFVKEQLEEGADFPMELFGATSVMTTKISRK